MLAKKWWLKSIKGPMNKIFGTGRAMYLESIKKLNQQSFSLRTPSYLALKCFSSLKPTLDPSQKQYECRKINDDLKELQETLSHNIQDIKSMLPNRGINTSVFFLKSFAKIVHEDQEVYDILYENIKAQLDSVSNPELLIELLEGKLFYCAIYCLRTGGD